MRIIEEKMKVEGDRKTSNTEVEEVSANLNRFFYSGLDWTLNPRHSLILCRYNLERMLHRISSWRIQQVDGCHWRHINIISTDSNQHLVWSSWHWIFFIRCWTSFLLCATFSYLPSSFSILWSPRICKHSFIFTTKQGFS